MKKLIVIPALMLAGCASMQPCGFVQTQSTPYQVGFTAQFGPGQRTTSRALQACPVTLNSDLLDPPIPFDDNMRIPQ